MNLARFCNQVLFVALIPDPVFISVLLLTCSFRLQPFRPAVFAANSL